MRAEADSKANHYAEKHEKGLEESEGSRTPQKSQPTKSTDWDSRGLAEMREPVAVRPRSSAYMLWPE